MTKSLPLGDLIDQLHRLEGARLIMRHLSGPIGDVLGDLSDHRSQLRMDRFGGIPVPLEAWTDAMGLVEELCIRLERERDALEAARCVVGASRALPKATMDKARAKRPGRSLRTPEPESPMAEEAGRRKGRAARPAQTSSTRARRVRPGEGSETRRDRMVADGNGVPRSLEGGIGTVAA